MTEGGGISRPLDQPMRTMNSQASAADTGSKSPSAGRSSRASAGLRCFGAAAAAGSAVTVICTTDIKSPVESNRRPSFRSGRTRRGPRRATAPIRSVRGLDVFVVDQVVDRLGDVDIGRQHAGLLQGEAGLQDRVALIRTDLVVVQ